MRVEERRIPEVGPKRDAYVAQVGADGFRLLDALARADAPPDAAALPAIGTLRRVWARHFERIEDRQDGSGQDGGARLRPVRGRGPGDRLESPHDTEARFRTKANTTWTGYMVHFTETCDPGAPRLVVHAYTIAKRSPGGSTREAGAGRPMSTMRSARRRSIWPLSPRTWRHPSTWWTRPMSARTISSPPTPSTASPWSALAGLT